MYVQPNLSRMVKQYGELRGMALVVSIAFRALRHVGEGWDGSVYSGVASSVDDLKCVYQSEKKWV